MGALSHGHDKPTGNQSLLRGFLLLEILSNYPNGCPLAHLAGLAQLNKSTVHRLLQGLQACGYVTPAPAAGSYRLTTRFITVGQTSLAPPAVLRLIAPSLQALNAVTGETVNFSRRDGDYGILIHKLEPTIGMLRTRAYLGQQMTLFSSAMGKLFLADDSEEAFFSYWGRHYPYIRKLTPYTITDPGHMKRELEDVRQRGVAFDREEHEVGVSCIAAPVFGARQRVKYAISLSLSSVKLHQIDEDTLLTPLRQTAEALSQALKTLPNDE
ncbi:transcriptional regulator, IclR family [Dickeya chrysanthemi Ech1591]|uniref:Transcriptional regulator, IclR family n=1 Tax=Dickeya chrysanthemi (strain Ech1591) TaxID=561229 RepID=C6CKQ8_DICC1|nr:MULTISPECIES: IclR family transcriptional regulator [Dickeya]ACT08422.1 transcriptional regulator, IclR family [Dickeya chrysanthemi Ech1591]TYL42947.1 IclR family transcriptional regulator [Dickeya sp. ws52]WJM85140.1 IclR family transcriptional regulator [Dickeya chrysanthemi]